MLLNYINLRIANQHYRAAEKNVYDIFTEQKSLRN